jgi:hypothetical protein
LQAGRGLDQVFAQVEEEERPLDALLCRRRLQEGGQLGVRTQQLLHMRLHPAEVRTVRHVRMCMLRLWAMVNPRPRPSRHTHTHTHTSSEWVGGLGVQMGRSHTKARRTSAMVMTTGCSACCRRSSAYWPHHPRINDAYMRWALGTSGATAAYREEGRVHGRHLVQVAEQCGQVRL